MATEERLLTVRELSERTGIPLVTIYRMAKLKKIPYYVVGPNLTGIRFSISEVRDALHRPNHAEVIAGK